MKHIIDMILEWNRMLFPLLALIFLAFVVIKSLNEDASMRLLNLDYKTYFILASGIVYVIDYNRKKNKR